MKKIKLSEVISKLEERGLHKSAENLKKVVGGQKSDLDKILKGTNFSSKTKALWAYYRSGIFNKTIRMFLNLIKKSKAAPPKEKVAFALILANIKMNGASPPGMMEMFRSVGLELYDYEDPGYIYGWRRLSEKYPKTLKIVYRKIRPASFRKWIEAINLIDKFR